MVERVAPNLAAEDAPLLEDLHDTHEEAGIALQEWADLAEGEVLLSIDKVFALEEVEDITLGASRDYVIKAVDGGDPSLLHDLELLGFAFGHHYRVDGSV